MDNLVIWVVAGEGYARTQGHHVHARAGEVISLARGRSHNYGAVPENPWEIYWAHFEGPLGASLFQQLRSFGPTPCHDVGLDATLRELFEQLLLVGSNITPTERERLDFPDLAADGLLHAILARMIHLLDTRRHLPRAHDETSLDVTDLRQFIRRHLTETLTLEDLADHAHLSVTHFSRLFRRHFGVSPMRYVIDQRMDHAAQLLAETGLSVKQIAAAMGYDDPYYFSRLFKKTTGLSPRRYREQHRGE